MHVKVEGCKIYCGAHVRHVESVCYCRQFNRMHELLDDIVYPYLHLIHGVYDIR